MTRASVAPRSQPETSPVGWSFGCEHEFGDWDRRRGLPAGWSLDLKDHTMVNSNGIAVDPRGMTYPFGGEALSRPTSTPAEQRDNFDEFIKLHPDVAVNYRSNLHVHVRVPGLRNDLSALKAIQSYVHDNIRAVFQLVEPVPVPTRDEYPCPNAYAGALSRYRRRLRSHQTVVSLRRYRRQMEASTPAEFFAAECPLAPNGRVLYHLSPRAAVNLRHLREATETVEFRHFPGTKDPSEVFTAVSWCRDFLLAALSQCPIGELLSRYTQDQFPTFSPYVHSMELRYRATTHDGTRTRQQIESSVAAILAGEFEDRSQSGGRAFAGSLSRKHQ